MTGTVSARPNAHLASKRVHFLDSAEVVISTLVVSACVTAVCSFVILSTVLAAREGPTPTVDLASVDHGIRPIARPTIPEALPELGFADDAPQLRVAPDLSTSAALTDDAPADNIGESRGVVVRVIEGSPPVLPLQRPTPDFELVQVARNITFARALLLPTPTQRPVQGALPVTEAALRPTVRPANLIVRSQQPDAATVEVARADVAAEVITPVRLDTTAVPRWSATRGGNSCSDRLARAIPRRPNSAAGGTAFMAELSGMGGGDRDNRIIAAAMDGNMPAFMRDLQPVTFSGLTSTGQQADITICVTPDYLSIGSDDDYVRAPLGLPAALRVADAFDMMLPTTRMVDAIYSQADVRLSPQPMEPTSQMSSTDYFMRHDVTLDAQFAQAGGRDGLLVAGHKKDVVLTNRLDSAPGRVAIYGWHLTNGNPIQPLSTVHGEYYADYSHGIRLVSRTAYINGQAVDLRSLLTDGQYASLLNSEGPLSGGTIRLAALN